MGKFIKGDVVVLPFPFSDLSTSKRRPALVLVDLKGNDLILCQITSKTFSDDLAVLIEVTDIENGTLNTVSNVRPNKLRILVNSDRRSCDIRPPFLYYPAKGRQPHKWIITQINLLEYHL
ncbi:MAG: type II toxin-antitoxin system PemK/MazF family toxin, partial [Clostridia bacterium]|nr:type II toxin-antitoxin system PemK/MazF family toxin [Clostridia bacterium]